MWNKPHLLNALADLLMLVAAAALLAAGAVWLVRVPTLPVRHVEFLQELPHTQRADIEQTLAGALRGNFFSLDLEAVRGALEKMPWVRKVELRRVWPARLEVKIEEHRPVARWGEGRGELVNSFGEVFAATPPEAELAALPLLYGPPGTAPEVLKRYAEFVGNFQPLAQKPVQVALSPRLAWQLKLDNGMLVDIGREQPKSPVGVRLARFIEVYPELIGKRTVRPAVVDLRYPNGFAMRVAGEGKGK
ncbi:cell division protein FtsQ/DivIB [Dechloromonas sp. H13]|uniref:cell division protein FtsQ/DivIB n=1 Tax=Dechloromonas sp. H13 TaxID=2570193 RepID=UPI0012918BBF|nr:cell division protein FtsQ/DivIB [Dechloromonas sp. H13]